MHTRFDDELDDLYFSLSDMAGCTLKAVALTTSALSGKETEAEKKAEALAEDIKKRYHQLEGLCMHLLLRRQPVAGDLRRISSVMRIIRDLERIGDNSADVAEVLTYCPSPALFHLVRLDAMCGCVEEMLTEAVRAFLSKDKERARKVVAGDDEVDEYFRQAKEKLTLVIKGGGKDSESAPDLLMIAKYLERMGDHAASIATYALDEESF